MPDRPGVFVLRPTQFEGPLYPKIAPGGNADRRILVVLRPDTEDLYPASELLSIRYCRHAEGRWRSLGQLTTAGSVQELAVAK